MNGALPEEYYLVYNGLTDGIATLEQLTRQFRVLQQEAEEMYIRGGREEIAAMTEPKKYPV